MAAADDHVADEHYYHEYDDSGIDDGEGYAADVVPVRGVNFVVAAAAQSCRVPSFSQGTAENSATLERHPSLHSSRWS